MLITKRLLIASTVAGLLASCSWFQSPGPAPVETGSEQGGAAYPDVPGQDTGSPYHPPAATSPYGGAPTPPAQPTGTYTPSNAPVDINAPTHTVVYGDTIYNVAKRYGITQDNLMQWNNLMDYNIQIGQVLNVKGSGYVAPAAVPPTAPPPVVQQPPVVPPAVTPPSSNAGVKNVAGIAWSKPTAAAAVTNFGGANKGIDYGGSLGQPIVSAADGKVVYSGSGLKGYGNLIIVQHNSRYLTAYGNNQSLLVKEGQQVKRGQKIATMGNTDANRVKLHFEVREDGKPVNPSRFLP